MNGTKSVEYYLWEYILSDAQIDALHAELNQRLATIADVESALKSMDKNESDRLSADAERLSFALLGEIGSITDRCEKVTAMIASLEDPEMRAVFEYRYYRRMTFSGIAKKLYMSKTKVQALHRSGLAILQERYG